MRGVPGLRTKRRKAKLTQRALADILNLSPVTISRYECGNLNARYNVIEQLAKVLKCSEQDLLFPQED